MIGARNGGRRQLARRFHNQTNPKTETMTKPLFNAAPTQKNIRPKSGAFQPRYSNKTVVNADGTTTTTQWYEDINWGGALGSLTNMFSNIWGRSSIYSSEMYQQMLEQEKKTTKWLIGIVIGLVLLAFAYIILKKK